MNNELTWSKSFRYHTMQWAVWFFKMYLRITSGRAILDVPDMDIASKESRMVDWHDSMDKTKSV